jgi:hypothetical protein
VSDLKDAAADDEEDSLLDKKAGATQRPEQYAGSKRSLFSSSFFSFSKKKAAYQWEQKSKHSLIENLLKLTNISIHIHFCLSFALKSHLRWNSSLSKMCRSFCFRK